MRENTTIQRIDPLSGSIFFPLWVDHVLEGFGHPGEQTGSYKTPFVKMANKHGGI